MTGSTAKSIKRRRQILETAQKLFNSKGFQETSISDITKSIGAAKGVFYYYFDTKEQLLDALIEASIGETAAAMLQIVHISNMNAFDKLKLMLQEEFRINMQNIDPDNHLHNIRNVDMHQKILVGMVEKLAPIICQVVEQGIHEGIFRLKHPLEISEILISSIHFITDLGIFHWNKEQYLMKVKASEELIEKALCIKDGSFGFLSEMLKTTPDMVEVNSNET